MNPTLTVRPKEPHRLISALITTFDFDPASFFSLPFSNEEFQRFIVFCGEGMEQYDEPPQDSEAYSCLGKIRIPVHFSKDAGGLPSGYLHGKTALFEYMDEAGNLFYHLVISSANLTPHDNLETRTVYTGKPMGAIQEKTKPLIQYLCDLKSFLPENGEYESKRTQLEELIDHLWRVCFEPASDNRCDDWSFLYGAQIRQALFQPCDEMTAVCPFIQGSELERLKETAGRLTLVSGTPMIMRLLKSKEDGADFVPVSMKRAYLHAKLYLQRTGESWRVLSGSANLTDYSLNRNMEFMDMRVNPQEIGDIRHWLASVLQMEEESFPESFEYLPESGDSAVFLNAARKETRYRFLSRKLNWKAAWNHQKERITEYVLSPSCPRDLIDSMRGLRVPAIPEAMRGNGGRIVFHYPFGDRILLELLNEAIHDAFDSCFSDHVYSHIRGRHFHSVFSLIRNTPDFRNLYLYKTDIARFDPSIKESILMEKLKKLPGMDEELLRFLGAVTGTDRGMLPAVKTGCPLSGFFENVILREIDSFLESRAVFFTRFADDILIGMKTEAETEAMARELNRMLSDLHLRANETKSQLVSPSGALTYLGWKIENGETDFTEETLASVRKEILRCQKRKLIQFEKNRLDEPFRLYLGVREANEIEKRLRLENAFHVISRPDGLKRIDGWISDMIRTLASGKTGKGKYRVSREQLHQWGNRSLVARYYDKISNRR